MDVEFKLSMAGQMIFTIRPTPTRTYRVIGIDRAMENAEFARRWLTLQEESKKVGVSALSAPTL